MAESQVEENVQEDAEVSSQRVHEAAVRGGLGEGVGLTLNDDYFDIESFLADQTLVDVATLDICPFGGFADKSSSASGNLHLKKGALVKLPLAAAGLLHDQGLVTVHMPSIFSEGVLINLRRCPTVVDVGALHPYYFEFGMKLARLFKDTLLASVLTTAAEKRMVFLLKLAFEHVEAERNLVQNRSGLISEAGASNSLEFKRSSGHHKTGSTSSAGEARASIAGDVFADIPKDGRQDHLDANIFLKGLSMSEALMFQKRKEEILRSFSYALL